MNTVEYDLIPLMQNVEKWPKIFIKLRSKIHVKI